MKNVCPIRGSPQWGAGGCPSYSPSFTGAGLSAGARPSSIGGAAGEEVQTVEEVVLPRLPLGPAPSSVERQAPPSACQHVPDAWARGASPARG